MGAQEIMDALDAGYTVMYDGAIPVRKDSIGQYLMFYSPTYCIGLTWRDGKTLNGKPEKFAIVDKDMRTYLATGGI